MNRLFKLHKLLLVLFEHLDSKLTFFSPTLPAFFSGWITCPVFLCSDRHDALFVVGSLDETLELRGLRYHPIDIETSVSRAHRSIAER